MLLWAVSAAPKSLMGCRQTAASAVHLERGPKSQGLLTDFCSACCVARGRAYPFLGFISIFIKVPKQLGLVVQHSLWEAEMETEARGS